MRKIQLLECLGLSTQRVPVAGRTSADAGSLPEYFLHRIAEYAKPCALAVQRHDYGMLLATRILMLVADDDAMAVRQRGDNHRIALQERGDAQREFRMSIPSLADPRGDVGRKPEPSVVGAGNVRNDAIDGADFDAGTDTLRAVREHGTGGMRMRKDEEPVRPVYDGNFARVIRALESLAAPPGRFDDNQRSVGSKRSMDTLIAHGVRSRISSRSTALRTALQNGSSSGFSVVQMPSVKTFAASSRPPSMVLNHVWP